MRDKGDRMLLLLLRWFGVLLAMASMLILVSSLSSGTIIDDSRSRPTGYGEVGEVKINWPVALPIGLGVSAGITCMVVAIRLEEQRSRSQRRYPNG